MPRAYFGGEVSRWIHTQTHTHTVTQSKDSEQLWWKREEDNYFINKILLFGEHKSLPLTLCASETDPELQATDNQSHPSKGPQLINQLKNPHKPTML